MKQVLLAVLLFGHFIIAAQKITRGPYLQQPTPTGLIIRWQTDVPTAAKAVVFTPDNSVQFTITDTVITTNHILTISNLRPNTSYRYRIGDGQTTLSDDPAQFFKTPPDGPNQRPVSVWVTGDFGTSNTPNYVGNQRAVYEQFLARRNTPTDLWLWLGDNAYCCGTDAEYQTQVFDFYGKTVFGNVPVLPVPGNHEYYGGYPNTGDPQKSRDIPYFRMISVPQNGEGGGVPSRTKAYYSTNYDNIHFIGLDSFGFDDGLYPLADSRSKQYQWLEADLAQNKSLWTVVMFHHPPFTKGSHDSDAEAELSALRQALVPLFDKYSVDLVLNGHSHVYERSYLMHHHTGHSTTFNQAAHVVNAARGNYAAGDAPVIKDSTGTIYMVVGSAGRLDWNGQPPHPSSVYANRQIGGSVVLDIDENRLNARWICSDGQTRDNFTVFKRVNRKETYHLNYGDSLTLNASWKGTYRWSTGDTKRSLRVTPLKSQLFVVRDSLGYLADSFYVNVAPQPEIRTFILSENSLCEGSKVKGKFSVRNYPDNSFEFSLQLIAPNEVKDLPLTLNLADSTFTTTLPENLMATDSLRLRLNPVNSSYKVYPSAAFLPKKKIAGTLTIEKPVFYYDTEMILKLTLSGPLPARVQLTALPESDVNTPVSEWRIAPPKSGNYRIEKLSNVCGEGTRDSIFVNIIPQPEIRTFILSENSLCEGSKVKGKFSVRNYPDNSFEFSLQLIAPNEIKDLPLTLNLADSTFTTTLPENLMATDSLRLQLVPYNSLYKVYPSAAFLPKKKLIGELTSEKPVLAYDSEILLTLTLNGTLPARVQLTTLPESDVNTPVSEWRIAPPKSGNYRIEKLGNVCGEGTAKGNGVSVSLPLGLATEPNSLQVMPNPVKDKLRVRLPNGLAVSEAQIFSVSGKLLKTFAVQPKATVEMDVADLPAGTYLLNVTTDKKPLSLRFVKE